MRLEVAELRYAISTSLFDASASSTEGTLGVLDSITATPTKAGCRPLAASLASCLRRFTPFLKEFVK